MTRTLRIVTMVVAALALLAGVVLGLMPVTAKITQLQPELRVLSAPCGNGFLQTTPPVQNNLIALPGESDVYLPKDNYVAQCAHAVGWRHYGSWALTALGVLGLAVSMASAGGSSSGGGRKKAPAQPASGGRRRRPDEAAAEPTSVDQAVEYDDYADDVPPASSGGGAHRRQDS